MVRICPVCGKREIGPRAAMCEPCARKQNREYYFRIGVCPTCRKNKLFGTERMCPECRAPRAERQLRRYHANIEKMHSEAKERSARRYQKRKAAGICYICNERKATTGYVTCKLCRVKRSNKERLPIPRSERVENGLCYFCGEPLDREGRSCMKCATRCSKTLEGNRPRRNETWRRANDLVFGERKKDEVSV